MGEVVSTSEKSKSGVAYVHPKLRVPTVDYNDKTVISYSQFSTWKDCQHRWKLRYVDKHRPMDDSIATVFGTAIHETLQMYIKTMFTVTVKAADVLDLHTMLLEVMSRESNALKEKYGVLPYTRDEFKEHVYDGFAILDWFKSNRSKYFTNRQWELVGIELPIFQTIDDNHPNVYIVGYIDVVLRNKKTKNIRIIDIKTSTKGWKDYQKSDKVKTAQLVMYKLQFARYYKIPVSKIDIVYFIVKRKLNENPEFPQRRVQTFIPSHGTVTQNMTFRDFTRFIDTAYDADGKPRTDLQLVANGKSCRFCPFATDEQLCPTTNRKT